MRVVDIKVKSDKTESKGDEYKGKDCFSPDDIRYPGPDEPAKAVEYAGVATMVTETITIDMYFPSDTAPP